jgi:prepilin-type N-terminal cleavage/methylation domain-containing protein
MTRKGFTLIETIVAIAILGVLLGVLLPAVQSAREAAHRTQCAVNLRQIGLAFNAYHATHGCFPPDRFGQFKPPSAPIHGRYQFLSSLGHLLPFLEQTALYASINFDLVNLPGPHFSNQDYDNLMPDHSNTTTAHTVLGVFLCPSDGGIPVPYGGLNYRANQGVGPGVRTWIEQPDSGNGFMPNNGPYSPPLGARHFPDGLAHTAAYSERLKGSGVRRSAK